MTGSWQALHAQFIRQSQSLTFFQRFRIMRAANQRLEPFPEPRSLLDYLRGPDGTQAAKNQVLHALLICRSKDGEVAKVLLAIALWPGLDRAYWRLRRAFGDDVGAVADELIGAFGECVSKADPARVTAVAATLVQNSQRDATRGLIKKNSFVSRVAPESVVELAELADLASEPAHDVFDNDSVWLRERMVRDFGEDAGLVYDVAVNDETQREAAQRLGLQYGAVRKRHQRTVERIRQARPDYLAPRCPMRAIDWSLGDNGAEQVAASEKGKPRGPQVPPHDASPASTSTIGPDSDDRRRLPERHRGREMDRASRRRAPPRK